MRRVLPFAALLAAVGLIAAGCNDGSKPGGAVVKPLPFTVIGTVAQQAAPTLPAAFKNGDATAGKAVFLSAGCTGCHTLKDAGSTGQVGPNLDQAKPAASRVYNRVLNGAGAMPSFKGKLSDTQIKNVIAYVTKATGGNPNG